MRKCIVAVQLAWLVTGCIVQTETVEGDAGPPGQDGKNGHDGADGKNGADGGVGPKGDTGVSPFSYVDPVAKTDIHYSGGKVGIGTAAPEASLSVNGNSIVGNPIAVPSDLISGYMMSQFGKAGIIEGHDNVIGGDIDFGFNVYRASSSMKRLGANATSRINLNGGSIGMFLGNDGAAGGDVTETVKLAVNPVGVGIGTAIPTVDLDVRSQAGNDLGAFASIGNHDVSQFVGIYSGQSNDKNPALYWPFEADSFRLGSAANTAGAAFVEALRITKEGYVGIGTTNPINKLHVASPGGNVCIARFMDPLTNSGFRFNLNDQLDSLGYGAPHRHALQFANAESFALLTGNTNIPRFVVDIDGKVGIGTTTPAGTLHIDAPASPVLVLGHNGATPLITAGGTNTDLYIAAVGAGGFLDFQTNGVDRLRVGANGNVGIGTTVPQSMLHVAGNIQANATVYPSDARLKSNIEPLGPSLEQILKLRGVTYRWKEPEKHGNRRGIQVGMIAQEVEDVFPDWVVTGPDGYKALSYPGFEALTVESFRELKTAVSALEVENARLRVENTERDRRLAELETRLGAAPATRKFGMNLDGFGGLALMGGIVIAFGSSIRRRKPPAS